MITDSQPESVMMNFPSNTKKDGRSGERSSFYFLVAKRSSQLPPKQQQSNVTAVGR